MVGSLTNLALDGRFQKRIEGSQHILAGAMGFATGSVHDAQSVHLFGWHHKAWQRVAWIHQTLKGLSRSGMLSQYSRGGERWYLSFRGVICLEEEEDDDLLSSGNAKPSNINVELANNSADLFTCRVPASERLSCSPSRPHPCVYHFIQRRSARAAQSPKQRPAIEPLHVHLAFVIVYNPASSPTLKSQYETNI